MNNWHKFLSAYKKVHVVDMKRASKLYRQWKKLHIGGGVVDSINEFLYKYLAKPIGRAIANRFA